MAMQDLSDRPDAAESDPASATAASALVLLVALLLVGGRIGLALHRAHAGAEPYILVLLAALSVVGVFSLFAGAAGILRHPAGVARPTAAQSRGRDGAMTASSSPMRADAVVYANAAYLALIDAARRERRHGRSSAFSSAIRTFPKPSIGW